MADFEERQFVGEIEEGRTVLECRNQLCNEMMERMRQQGAIWLQLTYLADEGMCVLEGWRDRPEDWP